MPTNRSFERATPEGAIVTAQRQVVCRVLEASRDPLDAEPISQWARKTDAKISFANYNRTLIGPTELQRVTTRDFGDHRTRFQMDDVGPHEHFIDLETDWVIEFCDPELAASKQQIAAPIGYRLERHNLERCGHSIFANNEPVGRRDLN